MDKQNIKENNCNCYLTMTNLKRNTSDKMNFSNITLSSLKGSEKFCDIIKQFVDYNLCVMNTFTEEILNTQENFSKIITPLTEVTQKVLELYEPFIDNISSTINEIFKEIDWTKFDFIYKEIAIKYLSNGFCPYHNTEIRFDELLETKSNQRIIKNIQKGIQKDIIKAKKDLFLMYPKYKKYIKEIYSLYKTHKYRLCILSLINLISIINNEQFDHIDFTEKGRFRQKLLEKQIMKNQETNYLLFSLYINDKDLKNVNKLLVNFSKTPEEYLKVPYNRHAITHGYSKKFGNKLNCLRWFSVLLNTLEISEELVELQ